MPGSAAAAGAPYAAEGGLSVCVACHSRASPCPGARAWGELAASSPGCGCTATTAMASDMFRPGVLANCTELQSPSEQRETSRRPVVRREAACMFGCASLALSLARPLLVPARFTFASQKVSHCSRRTITVSAVLILILLQSIVLVSATSSDNSPPPADSCQTTMASSEPGK